MNKKQLIEQIRNKNSYLCVGLDSDLTSIPRHLLGRADPILAFNKEIIDATKDYCVSYKINTAYYEAMGANGWEIIQKTREYIPSTHFTIADAKRGDIGNTSAKYAKAFFEVLNFDAVTVSPYMGQDSVKPFLEYEGKWTILLGLTSNPGAQDFEMQKIGDEYLYEKILKTASRWGTPENTMFVIGATHPGLYKKIRSLTPDHFYLVPGIGRQGGSLKEISQRAANKDVGLLVSISRSIIYTSDKEDFASAAAAAAERYQTEMKVYL